MSVASAFGSAIIPRVSSTPIEGSIGWFGSSSVIANETFPNNSVQNIFTIVLPAGVYSFSCFLTFGILLEIYNVQAFYGATFLTESGVNHQPGYITTANVPLSGIFKSDGVTSLIIRSQATTQLNNDYIIYGGSKVIYTRIA